MIESIIENYPNTSDIKLSVLEEDDVSEAGFDIKSSIVSKMRFSLQMDTVGEFSLSIKISIIG